jgi:hypothetical protein
METKTMESAVLLGGVYLAGRVEVIRFLVLGGDSNYDEIDLHFVIDH